MPVTIPNPQENEEFVMVEADGSAGQQVESKVPEKQLLSDKQVADVVEAILGACAHEDSTLKGAMRALHNIYNRAFALDWEDYVKNVPVPVRTGKMRDGGMVTVRKMEECFGYEFKDHFWLLEAFTHPSSCDRSVNSYQRLEFLGEFCLIFFCFF